MLWLACYNPEIDWKTREMKIMRCSEEYGKKLKTKQTKPGWQKQKEKEQKKEKVQREKKEKFRKPTVEEEIERARMIEEKQDEEKDLIEIRVVGKIVPRRFHKYLKMFKKKKSEKMLMRKT